MIQFQPVTVDPVSPFYSDNGVGFIPDHPSSRWPRTEQDIQAQELREAWAEVEAIAPGLPNDHIAAVVHRPKSRLIHE